MRKFNKQSYSNETQRNFWRLFQTKLVQEQKCDVLLSKFEIWREVWIYTAKAKHNMQIL